MAWSTFAAGCLLAVAGFSGACANGRDESSAVEARPDAELLALFESEAIRWIRAERERSRPLAVPLGERDLQSLAGYFSDDLLARTRMLVVDGFDNPAFFSIFEERGEPYPVDLRRASGLALVDTVLIARTAAESAGRDQLLFHELVHLAQYDALGIEEYLKSYVASWAANGRDYRAIPHEEQAFDLASQYWRDREPFRVEAEVRSRFAVAAFATPR